MRFAQLTTSTAILLLSSTALVAQQEATPMNIGNVYLDVGGTAVQVPIALAAEACGSDVMTLQEAAAAHMEEQGLDSAQIHNQADATGTVSADDATGTGDGATSDTATADAGAGAEAGGTQTAATGTDAAQGTAAAGEEAPTSDTANVDASGTSGQEVAPTDSEGTDLAAAGSDTESISETASGDVQNVETTAADTAVGGVTAGPDSSTNEELLMLAVCQVDQAQATELGIAVPTTGETSDGATE